MRRELVYAGEALPSMQLWFAHCVRWDLAGMASEVKGHVSRAFGGRVAKRRLGGRVLVAERLMLIAGHWVRAPGADNHRLASHVRMFWGISADSTRCCRGGARWCPRNDHQGDADEIGQVRPDHLGLGAGGLAWKRNGRFVAHREIPATKRGSASGFLRRWRGQTPSGVALRAFGGARWCPRETGVGEAQRLWWRHTCCLEEARERLQIWRCSVRDIVLSLGVWLTGSWKDVKHFGKRGCLALRIRWGEVPSNRSGVKNAPGSYAGKRWGKKFNASIRNEISKWSAAAVVVVRNMIANGVSMSFLESRNCHSLMRTVSSHRDATRGLAARWRRAAFAAAYVMARAR
jgi:hypothetical protein